MVLAKTILITGVSSGFGQALAREALALGHRVIGTVRTREARRVFGRSIRSGLTGSSLM